MAKKHWMAAAFGKHPGKFTAKAEKKGESVSEYAASVKAHPDKRDTTTLREANAAKTGARISRAHARKKARRRK